MSFRLQRPDNLWLVMFSRLVLVGVFLMSGITKLQRLGDFITETTSYGILPEGLLHFIALVLPGVEIACAALLLFGLFIRPTAYVTAFIAVVFIAANSLSLVEGGRTCGCFGNAISLGPGSAIMVDVGMLILASLIVVGRTSGLSLWQLRHAKIQPFH